MNVSVLTFFCSFKVLVVFLVWFPPPLAVILRGASFARAPRFGDREIQQSVVPCDWGFVVLFHWTGGVDNRRITKASVYHFTFDLSLFDCYCSCSEYLSATFDFRFTAFHLHISLLLHSSIVLYLLDSTLRTLLEPDRASASLKKTYRTKLNFFCLYLAWQLLTLISYMIDINESDLRFNRPFFCCVGIILSLWNLEE
jgi:hypothetical protein